jgi:hypothetical protein
MKAICVLEAILRKKDDEPYSIISSYFSENSESVVRCCDLPQVSLREKATKVGLFCYILILVLSRILSVENTQSLTLSCNMMLRIGFFMKLCASYSA